MERLILQCLSLAHGVAVWHIACPCLRAQIDTSDRPCSSGCCTMRNDNTTSLEVKLTTHTCSAMLRRWTKTTVCGRLQAPRVLVERTNRCTASGAATVTSCRGGGGCRSGTKGHLLNHRPYTHVPQHIHTTTAAHAFSYDIRTLAPVYSFLKPQRGFGGFRRAGWTHIYLCQCVSSTA